MLYGVYEFEIVKDESGYVALPYDFGGGTQGDDWEDLCLMVADWLKMTLEDYDIHGRELPKPTFGNEPRYGGRNLVFGCTAGRETVDKVTASEAARLLGVSPSHVSQMLASDQLEGWRDGRSTYVTVDSVAQRLREDERPDKPGAAAVA